MKDLDAIANEIKELNTASKLRLAAELIERGQLDLARQIAAMGAEEISLHLFLGKTTRQPKESPLTLETEKPRGKREKEKK